jgi:hypothetical protein
MFKFMQEDGVRALRLVYNPTVGHIAIGRLADGEYGPYIAYPNDDYANRTGEIAFYADTFDDIVAHAKFRDVPTCNCEHAVHELSLREHPMFREAIDPATARSAMHVGKVCDHCADTHMADYMDASRW